MIRDPLDSGGADVTTFGVSTPRTTDVPILTPPVKSPPLPCDFESKTGIRPPLRSVAKDEDGVGF